MQGKTIEKVEFGNDLNDEFLILTMTDGSVYTIEGGSSCYSTGMITIYKDKDKPKDWYPEELIIYEGEKL